MTGNLARMTTATTGTGTITLGSAAAGGYITFADSGIVDAQIVSYGIIDGSNKETGYGVYTSSGTTLTRTVLNSNNSNNAISLSGTAEVYVTPLNEDVKFIGARVKKAADQTTADYSGQPVVAWDAEVFDVGGWHDNVTENTKLTVPAGLGIQYIEVSACIHETAGTAGQRRVMQLKKNGAHLMYFAALIEGGTEWAISSTSGPLQVVAGDYFEVFYFSGGDNSITIESDDSYFAARKLG